MQKITKDLLEVEIYKDRPSLGLAAADKVSEKINELLQSNQYINMVFAAAPSQNEFLDFLKKKEIDWNRVRAFHMDEYVGLNADAPQLFGNYLRTNFFNHVGVKEVFYINGNTGDAEQECKRYAALLDQYPTDIVILGIGENTHLAFNDPHVADFNDPKVVKVVDLDEKNRLQQVDAEDPYCFDVLDKVPTHAITLTIPTLFKAHYAYAIVPGVRKADAIYHTLHAEIGERYPSTLLRQHKQAVLFIDEDSAAKL